ncbi:hypothetical protein Lser_V15G36910 [Lactuca serriola]
MNVEMGGNIGEDRNDSFDDLDLTGFDNDDIVASLASSANVASHENLDAILYNVDDVVPPTTKTRKSSETIETETPTFGQMVSALISMETVIGCSPSISASPTTCVVKLAELADYSPEYSLLGPLPRRVTESEYSSIGHLLKRAML